MIKIVCLFIKSDVLDTTKRVELVEPVGKRDGFGNPKYWVPEKDKLVAVRIGNCAFVKVISPTLVAVAIVPTLVEFTTIVYTEPTVTAVIELITAFVTLKVAGDIPVVVAKLPTNIPNPRVIELVTVTL